MPRMFGTDGVRGLANRALTAQLALDLGDAAVRVLGDDGGKSEFDGRRRALVGRDTRVSGDFLAAALSAGMSAGGFDVIDAGIIPTPGVAYLTSVLNVEMGAVISASHNPMPDNGIKFFARGGFKLPDTKEDEIESVLGQDWERPTGAGVGRISHDTATATNLYIDHLVSTIAPIGPDKSQPTPLKGLKVVADCANGATSVVAPEALRRAGADVSVINASPDGYNINKNAGSTHPEQLQAMVKASGADLGVAFDGDADPLPCRRRRRQYGQRRPDHGHSCTCQEKRGQTQPRHPRGNRDEQPRSEARPAFHGHQNRANRRGRSLRA